MQYGKRLTALFALCLISIPVSLSAQEQAPADTSQSTKLTTAYETTELISLIAEEMVLPYSSAQRWITDRVTSICDRGTSSCSYGWQGKKLVVTAEIQQHDKIKQLFSMLKKHGMQAVSIQSLVLRVPQSELANLAIPWQPIPNDAPTSPTDTQTSSSDEVVPASASGTSAASRVLAALHANGGTPLGTEDLVTATRQGLSQIPTELQRPPGANGSNWSVASSAVKRTTPVLFSVLAPDQHQQLVERVRNSEQVQREFHPKLIVFNGVQAAINNSIERQFVTRLESKKLMINDQPQVTFQPKLETFEEGINIKLLPVMFSKDEVRLTYHLKLCNFRSIDVLELPRFDGQSNYRVQVPEVAMTQFSTRVDIPIDYSLVVCAFEKNSAGSTDAVIVLSQCSIAKPPAQAKQSTPPTEQ